MPTTNDRLAEYASILSMIEGDAQLRAIYHEVQARMQSDPAHDITHLIRVASWAVRLGSAEVPPRLAVAAALLHDIVNLPKDDPRRAQASTLSAEVTRALLLTLGFSEGDVELVADAVRDHSFSRGATPVSSLGRALQDADRLEALGALGVFRCIATGVRMNAAFFDTADPWAKSRPLDDERFSVDHFFKKLLRLPETFLTEAGRREALRRARIMRDMLTELGHEIGHPLPSSRLETSRLP